MFRRKSVLAQGLCEEKSVYECLNKLMIAQTRVSEQQLRWAKAEENPLFLCLFGRLAELTWMGNELIRQFQDKQTELNRVFRDIDQEEKIVDESRKALLACQTKYLKLQKQLEHSKKKNDAGKIQSIEIELTTQGSLREHLKESVEKQSHKLELYKVDLLKKGLKSQAQTYLDISINYQALFNAQLQLADMLCLETPRTLLGTLEEPMEQNVAEEMKLFLSQVTESLRIYPPTNGGVNVKKLSEVGQSPPFTRRSSAEEAVLKSGRSAGKTHHSISQPILVGYNQNAPTEEVAPVQNALILPQCPIVPEDVAVLSGEYCEIESPGIPEEDEDECYSEPLARRSAIGLGSTQAGDGCWSVAQQRNGEQQQTSKGVLQSPGLYRSRDSVTNEESASSSSAEDLKSGKETDTLRQETPSLEMRMSDECYANPVDAINEFLQGRDAEFSPKSIVPQVETESTTQLLILKSLGEEPSLQAQQTSKEIQLQLFHERLFKDQTSSCGHQTPSNGSSEVDTDSIHNRPHDYSEIDDEPTYSNPFDALAESAYRPPYRVKIDKLKRNVSMSASAIQLSKQQSSGSSTRCSNSPPPPPVPIKDEKKIVGGLNHKPMRYGRRGSGENEPRGAPSIARSESSASVSSVPQQQQQRVWERREPVWKRNNSRRGSDDGAFLPQRPGADHEDKPEAPLSVAER
ncbi:hypothetical protein GBAR_LOCUS1440, partial [Geodia barretti]